MKSSLLQLIVFGSVALTLVVPSIGDDRLSLPGVRQILSDIAPGEKHLQPIHTRRTKKDKPTKSIGKNSATNTKTEKSRKRRSKKEKVTRGEDHKMPRNPIDHDALARTPTPAPTPAPSMSPASSASPAPTCLECDDGEFLTSRSRSSSSAFNNILGAGGSRYADEDDSAAGGSVRKLAAYLCSSLLLFVIS
jgi:hypothetical protein